MRLCFLAFLTFLASPVSTVAKTVEVVTSPVTLDYDGAMNCYNAVTGAQAYFVALQKPKWVTKDENAYLATLSSARDAFGRILVWEGLKSSKSREEVAQDVADTKEKFITSLHQEKDFSTVLAVYNEQAKVCLKHI